MTDNVTAADSRVTDQEANLALGSADVVWRKAEASNCNGACLEVAEEPDRVRLRDSKQSSIGYPDMIRVSPWSWLMFLRSLSGGHVPAVAMVEAVVHHDGSATVHCRISGTNLSFTEIEWSSFLDGVDKQEFGRVYSDLLAETAV